MAIESFSTHETSYNTYSRGLQCRPVFFEFAPVIYAHMHACMEIAKVAFRKFWGTMSPREYRSAVLQFPANAGLTDSDTMADDQKNCKYQQPPPPMRVSFDVAAFLRPTATISKTLLCTCHGKDVSSSYYKSSSKNKWCAVTKKKLKDSDIVHG